MRNKYSEKFDKYYSTLNLVSVELDPQIKYILWCTLQHEQRAWIRFKSSNATVKEFKSMIHYGVGRSISYVPHNFRQTLKNHPAYTLIKHAATQLQKNRAESSNAILQNALDVIQGTTCDVERKVRLEMCDSSIGWLKNRTRFAM